MFPIYLPIGISFASPLDALIIVGMFFLFAIIVAIKVSNGNGCSEGHYEHEKIMRDLEKIYRQEHYNNEMREAIKKAKEKSYE